MGADGLGHHAGLIVALGVIYVAGLVAAFALRGAAGAWTLFGTAVATGVGAIGLTLHAAFGHPLGAEGEIAIGLIAMVGTVSALTMALIALVLFRK